MKVARKKSSRLTALLGFIFFFSGFASLIYQVVWQRLLTLHYGVGTVSITIIVSVYMLGLGAGALVGGRLAERVTKKIFLYFIVELLIGCFGLISLPFLGLLGRHTAGNSLFISSLCMFLFLCVPTFLMGITLPLLIKIYNRMIRHFLKSVSFLYFINTLGAAVGALFAAYVVISFFGLDIAVYFAAAINFVLAGLIYLAGFSSPPGPVLEEAGAPKEAPDAILGDLAYPLVFLSGFLAIGYEIIWFRIIGVLVKASPYAFSTVLSVYLLGIALGSLSMERYLRRRKDIEKRSLFFLIQFLIGVSIMITVIGYYYLTKYTPVEILTRSSFSVELHPSIPTASKGNLIDLFTIADVLLWPIFFELIPTFFIGASFPLISFLALARPSQEGKTVGSVYFFLTIGNVLGGIFTGFFLLPSLGAEITLVSFSCLNILMVMFVSNFQGRKLAFNRRGIIALSLVLAGVALFPKGGRLYQAMHGDPGEGFETYYEEGIDGVIFTYQRQDEVRNYINGLNHGIRPGPYFITETIEALSFAPAVESVLIIGYGTGSITETILKMKDTKKVTVVELNKTLMKNLNKMPVFREILSDSRIELTIDDGRRYLLRTNEKYDLIFMDPLRATSAYSNNIYSREFFELAQGHLKPGGVLLVSTDEIQVIHKTVATVFDHVLTYNLGFSIYSCIASDRPFKRNESRIKDLVEKFSPQMQELIYRAANNSINMGNQDVIRKTTQELPINEDWRPVSEYYLGLKLKRKD
jgi:predicted membrane-bound spermidine synthase